MRTYNRQPHFNMINQKHIHLAANTTGRDFVVGDLHGCYDELMHMLNIIDFNFSNDRLFSVGDVIDRGPNSLSCAQLIYEPWFHAVKGNHEQLMVESMLYTDRSAESCWRSNGGSWAIYQDDQQLMSIAADMQQLPLIISVGEGDTRFNVVHADLMHRQEVNGHPEPVLVTDQMIDDWVFNETDEAGMLWGRTVFTLAKVFHDDSTKRFHDNTLSTTYVGHTQVRDNVMINRQVYLDTAAVNHYIDKTPRLEYCLTIAEPNANVLFKMSTHKREFTTTSMDCMLKYCQ